MGFAVLIGAVGRRRDDRVKVDESGSSPVGHTPLTATSTPSWVRRTQVKPNASRVRSRIACNGLELRSTASDTLASTSDSAVARWACRAFSSARSTTKDTMMPMRRYSTMVITSCALSICSEPTGWK